MFLRELAYVILYSLDTVQGIIRDEIRDMVSQYSSNHDAKRHEGSWVQRIRIWYGFHHNV